ncbi:MAG TPA: hypothetical protein VFT90_06520, partial [Chryseosolibacter sp.]|nr:hypothetical protein [Chryseosolibacter sp.]
MKNDLRLDALIKRLMRFAWLQLAISIALSASVIAAPDNQKEILDKHVTFEVKNQPLKIILERIERSVNVKFAYSKDAIDSFDDISLKVEHERLGEVLDKLFKPRKIAY